MLPGCSACWAPRSVLPLPQPTTQLHNRRRHLFPHFNQVLQGCRAAAATAAAAATSAAAADVQPPPPPLPSLQPGAARLQRIRRHASAAATPKAQPPSCRAAPGRWTWSRWKLQSTPQPGWNLAPARLTVSGGGWAWDQVTHTAAAPPAMLMRVCRCEAPAALDVLQ